VVSLVGAVISYKDEPPVRTVVGDDRHVQVLSHPFLIYLDAMAKIGSREQRQRGEDDW
jgi:hypothetical protein